MRETFLETLRLHGFIPAFVVAMDNVLEDCKSNPIPWARGNSEWSFGVTLESLELLLNTSLGYRWLPAVIEAGLLRMMAGIATEFPSTDGEVLDDATDIWSSEKLKGAEIFDDWDLFRDLAEKRASLLDGLESRRACDNLECGKIQNNCRRCSGCKIHYYCSSDCQLADWKHGGHRDHCGSPTLFSLGETSSCPLGFRERNFLRAVVQEDYADRINSICEAQVIFMANHPADQFFTFFDYTHTLVHISVHPVGNSLSSEDT
ncbi:hypothetical protein B0H12DRAFT_1235321 [Mycena haematopus]|nr:hypothetical protein B0H12DRAFT_1235321 [Mycena haematopus]